MSSKAVKISVVLLCLLALGLPSAATSAAQDIPTPSPTPPSAEALVITEVNPASYYIGESALVSVRLNNVPVEGYKSAEFTCAYNAGLVEKSNLLVTDLFGSEPVVAIHEPQSGTFIVAIAGANSNRAMASGVAFSFSAKGLQPGQLPIQCTARVSRGDNLPIDLPWIAADLTVLGVELPTVTPSVLEHPTMTSTLPSSPTPMPLLQGTLGGQFLASKPVTVRLLDANRAEITSLIANPDGTFIIMPVPGEYTVVATANGYLSHQGPVTIVAGYTSSLPTTRLLAGDVDGNQVIDQFDALTIGMSYMTSIPEAANLNNDAVIDFLDLELLAENYHQTGPSAWN